MCLFIGLVVDYDKRVAFFINHTEEAREMISLIAKSLFVTSSTLVDSINKHTYQTADIFGIHRKSPE